MPRCQNHLDWDRYVREAALACSRYGEDHPIAGWQYQRAATVVRTMRRLEYSYGPDCPAETDEERTERAERADLRQRLKGEQ